MFLPPGQPRLLTFYLHHVHGCRLEILLHDYKVAAVFQLYKITRVQAQIDNIAHLAVREEHIPVDYFMGADEMNFFRAYGEHFFRTGDPFCYFSTDEIGHAHKPSDEWRLWTLINFSRRAHLFHLASIEHRDTVAHCQ